MNFVFMFKDLIFFFLFKALSVPSSGGDSWTKQVSYTGSEPNSEVLTPKYLSLKNIVWLFIDNVVQLDEF